MYHAITKALIRGLTLWAIAQAPAAIAGDLQQIRDRGYLIVGVKENLRPLGFRDNQGQLQGLEIDLARQLAQDLLGDGDRLRLVPLLNQERLPALFTGEVDVIIADLTLTADRLRLVQFSPIYHVDGLGMISLQTLPPDPAQWRGYTLAILPQTAIPPAWRSLGIRWQIVPSYEAAWQTLARGQAAAFLGDRSVLVGWAQGDPRYTLSPQQWSFEPLAMAIPKGQQYRSLREWIDSTVNQWQRSGWLDQRRSAWGLVPEETPLIK